MQSAQVHTRQALMYAAGRLPDVTYCGQRAGVPGPAVVSSWGWRWAGLDGAGGGWRVRDVLAVPAAVSS